METMEKLADRLASKSKKPGYIQEALFRCLNRYVARSTKNRKEIAFCAKSDVP